MADTIYQYETYTMTDAINIVFPPSTLLLDLFFRGKEQFNSHFLQFEVMKDGKWLAPFVRPESQGEVRENLGYATNTLEAPYTKTLRKIDAADLLKKQFGKGVYTPANAPSMVSEWAARALREEKDAIWRLMEWMAASILQTGKVTVNGKGYKNWIVDFNRNATHTYTLGASAKWTESTSNPIKDITDSCRLIENDSGHIADVCVMGTSAAENFVNNTKVQTLMDIRRLDVGEVKPKDALPAGVTLSRDPDKVKAKYPKKVKYIATLATLASGSIDLFSYSENYTDGGTSYPMLTATKVIVGSTDAIGKKLFGAIADLDYGAPTSDGMFVAEEIFVKRDRTWNPSAEWMLVQAAPMPALMEPDSTVCVTVCDS